MSFWNIYTYISIWSSTHPALKLHSRHWWDWVAVYDFTLSIHLISWDCFPDESVQTQITSNSSHIPICSTIESIKHNSNHQFLPAVGSCSSAPTWQLIGQVCEDVRGFYCERGWMNKFWKLVQTKRIAKKEWGKSWDNTAINPFINQQNNHIFSTQYHLQLGICRRN